jgi:uncharacterized protein YbjT (DUF2867 family)
MGERRVGVLGATSHVGDCLLGLLTQQGWEVVAFSRRAHAPRLLNDAGMLRWEQIEIESAKPDSVSPPQNDAGVRDENILSSRGKSIASWISLVPVVTLPRYFPMLAAYGASRVVALSSTSRDTKDTSSDPAERAWVQRLIQAEESLIAWAQANGVEWIILRPTLIYGLGRDRNISVVARFIRRFGFFPLLGNAVGLRQPVHARDVSKACYETLISRTPNRAYTISGAEVLTYREMVARVFGALNKPVRFLVLPNALFRVVFLLLRFVPGLRFVSMAMVERMNRDLAFDHADAARDFGFSPSRFQISAADLPDSSERDVKPSRLDTGELWQEKRK